MDRENDSPQSKEEEIRKLAERLEDTVRMAKELPGMLHDISDALERDPSLIEKHRAELESMVRQMDEVMRIRGEMEKILNEK